MRLAPQSGWGTSRQTPQTPQTTGPALGWLLALLDAVGSEPIGKRVRQCPAHRDAAPSLSIGQGDDGRAVLHCHAGCAWTAVLGALRLPVRYLYRPPPIAPDTYATRFTPAITFPPVAVRGGHPAAHGYRFEAEHAYGDRWWLLRYRHPATGAKAVSWECLNPDGQRVPGLLGTPMVELPLYRERDVRMGVAAGEPVLLVESESSVDALRGWYATTWAGGAGAVPVARVAAVLGEYREVVVVPDHDEAGLGALAVLRDADLAPHVLLGEPGEDARDVLARLGARGFRAEIIRVLRGSTG